MKKIMFNDRFLLTQAVLEGRKTQTRRLVKIDVPLGNYEEAMTHSTYKVGEVVAVAQRYSDVGAASFDEWERNSDWFKKGFSNKMFVKSELMPYHIKITDVRMERLQDISDEVVYGTIIDKGYMREDKTISIDAKFALLLDVEEIAYWMKIPKLPEKKEKT